MTGTTRSSADLDPRRRKALFRAWHRGTREMDLILGGFADAFIDTLSDAELTEFERLLGEKLAELFDPAVPFRATDDAEHTCRYCDYRQICRR